MNAHTEKNQIKLFRDPLDPRELSFGFSQPHVEPSHTSGTGCICEDGFGMNLSCPLHAPVSVRNNAQRAGEKTEKKLARANDPGTSKAAAKTVKRFAKDYHNKILNALHYGGSCTFYEIANIAELEPSQVWRRLNELQRKGLIETTGEERKGPTGRMCRVWRLK